MPNFIEIGPVVWISIADTHGTHIDFYILEYIYKCSGISGNGQRNYALSKITNEDTLLYYLDDDNIIHPKLYNY